MGRAWSNITCHAIMCGCEKKEELKKLLVDVQRETPEIKHGE